MKVLILTFLMLVCYFQVSANPLPSERSSDGTKSCSKHGPHHQLSREVKGEQKRGAEEGADNKRGDPDDLMNIFRSFSKKDIGKARDIMKNVRRLVDIVDDIASKDDGTLMNYASKALRAWENFNGMRNMPSMENFFGLFTSGSGAGAEDAKKKKDPMESAGDFFSNMIKKFNPNN